MNERIIENWLTKTNERSFMLPFSQLLISQGYKLYYVSHHTMMEAGKDIIAEKGKKFFCYQVKEGNVPNSKFTSILGELNELLTHPIIHPSIPIKTAFRSFLVATGEVGDPVRTKIVERNNFNWGQTRKTKLECIDKGQLLPDFIQYFGSFFPSEPKNFKLLLEFYLSDGSTQFPKAKFSAFLEEYLGIYSAAKVSPRQLGSFIAASVVMTSYALTPWIEKKNYIAQIDALTCLSSYILALVNKNKLAEKHWKMSFNLINGEVNQLFLDLLDELKQRNHLVEGDWFPDVVVYRARASIVAGYICAFALMRKLCGNPLSAEDITFIHTFCEKYAMKMKFSGESFTPLFINFALFLESLKSGTGFLILQVMISGLITKRHIPQPYGWPNPYYDYEETIEITNGFASSKEHFLGTSYFLKPTIELFVRRNFRDFISSFWRKISHIQTVKFIPKLPWEYFLWKSENGKKESLFPRQTESWSRLQKVATDSDFSTLPAQLTERPDFAVLFITVFPHRVNEYIYRFIDHSLHPKLFH